MAKKQLIGTITSDKMQKTRTVRVEQLKEHPKYRKRIKLHQNYKAHVDKEEDFVVGDKVVIEECKPMSKDKRWKVIKKVN